MELNSIQDTPPSEIREESYLADESAIIRQLEGDFLREELADRQQDRELRRVFADRIYRLARSWIVGMILLLVAQGVVSLTKWFHLSDQVLMVALGSTTVTVIGILHVVASYLFPNSLWQKLIN